MAKLSASGAELLKQMQEAAEEQWGARLTKPYDPLIEMAVFASDPDLPPMLKFSANKEISQYVYAKRKSVEIEGDSATRILLVQFSNTGDERIIGEIHDGVTSDVRIGHEDATSVDVPLAHDQPDDAPVDTRLGLDAPGRGDNDIRRH